MGRRGSAFDGYFSGKTVLVTGHTGFKGSWLAIWLSRLGARVVGYALAPPSEPSHFQTSRLADHLTHVEGDVRDEAQLRRVFEQHKPEVVFHLAAQAIVREGYVNPRYTFETNFMGTVNVVEAASRTGTGVILSVTTDKCYENQEWSRGYRETDRLGGFDPYSASKAAAELALNVYRSPEFWRHARLGQRPRLASGRAGNAIGGGDWAADRLIPDVVRSLASGSPIVLRHPNSTRPWQHVLEAVSGYLTLAWRLATSDGFDDHVKAYNFGPPASSRGIPVLDVVEALRREWKEASSELTAESVAGESEPGLLQLDSTRAEAELGWRPTWPLETTLARVAQWYQAYYEAPDEDTYESTVDQIAGYCDDAAACGQVWV